MLVLEKRKSSKQTVSVEQACWFNPQDRLSSHYMARQATKSASLDIYAASWIYAAGS